MRRKAREVAFKLIFEKAVSGGDAEISYNVLTTEEELSNDAKSYVDEVVQGVDSKHEFLREIIARNTTGFVIERIFKIDIAILMLACYEILFMEQIPDKVSANEAVELAKIYSTDKSPSFVNGVLSTIIASKEDILNECENN